MAAAIAQATERIEIGTAIVPVYNRPPAVLAMAAATLAELAEGRFVLGLGTASHALPTSMYRKNRNMVSAAVCGRLRLPPPRRCSERSSTALPY